MLTMLPENSRPIQRAPARSKFDGHLTVREAAKCITASTRCSAINAATRG
jgi:hypothetical protein